MDYATRYNDMLDKYKRLIEDTQRSIEPQFYKFVDSYIKDHNVIGKCLLLYK